MYQNQNILNILVVDANAEALQFLKNFCNEAVDYTFEEVDFISNTELNLSLQYNQALITYSAYYLYQEALLSLNIPVYVLNTSEHSKKPNNPNVTFLDQKKTTQHLEKLKSFGQNYESKETGNPIPSSSIVTLFKIDQTGVVLNWNQLSEDIFGYTENEIINQPIDMVLPVSANGAGEVTYFDPELLSSSCIKWKGRTKFGVSIDLILSAAGIPTDNENTMWVCCQEITEQNQLVGELNSYKDALQNSTLSISIIDHDGKFVKTNTKFNETYGYNLNELDDQHVSMLRADFENNEDYISLWQTIKRGECWNGKLLEKNKSGDCFWTKKSITPMLDSNGRPKKFLMVGYEFRDVKEANNENKERELIEKSLRMKDEFLANMSHEIRTPLNVILGYADLLLEGELSKTQFKQAVTIKKSGKLLLSLINDILDLSKLESGKFTLDNSPFRIKEMIYSVKDMLELQAAKKDLDFHLSIDDRIPEVLIGDSTRIEQILVNLANNALKFTRLGFVRIKVELVKEEKETMQLRFRVIDSGIGIAKDKLDTIFESFTQTSKYITREFGGTGLGLTIVKKLLVNLNGSINVESTLNKGSEFTVNIPFRVPSEEQKQETLPELNNVSQISTTKDLNLNILLVEDNEFNQVLAQTRLQSWKCNVDIANNGLEALEKLRKNDYHIVLMDIQMPIMDGYETTRRIRSEFHNYKGQIPIIALTAHASNSSANEARKLGFNDYLFKPFNAKVLHSKLVEFGSLSISDEQEHHFEENNTIATPDAVDFSYIENEALGHSNIIKMLIESFLKEFDLFLNNAKEANAKADWNGVYKAVHRIGPSVSNFNVKALKPFTTKLYEISKQEVETECYTSLINEIENVFTTVKPIFKEKIKSIEKQQLQDLTQKKAV